VTPQVIANVQEFIDGDKDLLDGYDELPTEAQAKIDYALEHGHVPDEDWKGVSLPTASGPLAWLANVCVGPRSEPTR
jgi:hypothetical protein